jgi:hypothetical protein
MDMVLLFLRNDEMPDPTGVAKNHDTAPTSKSNYLLLFMPHRTFEQARPFFREITFPSPWLQPAPYAGCQPLPRVG